MGPGFGVEGGVGQPDTLGHIEVEALGLVFDVVLQEEVHDGGDEAHLRLGEDVRQLDHFNVARHRRQRVRFYKRISQSKADKKINRWKIIRIEVNDESLVTAVMQIQE